MNILGWFIWVIFLFWSLSCLSVIFKITLGGEKGLDHVLQRKIPTTLTFIDGILGIIIAIAFIITPLNKLHLAWIGPTIIVSVITVGSLGAKIGLFR